MMDLKAIRLEALFYHNAITYERHGFSYFSGYQLMKRIHEGFQPGGKIFEKLDNSTPFRNPSSPIRLGEGAGPSMTAFSWRWRTMFWRKAGLLRSCTA
jgi:hypothetical protein